MLVLLKLIFYRCLDYMYPVKIASDKFCEKHDDLNMTTMTAPNESECAKMCSNYSTMFIHRTDAQECRCQMSAKNSGCLVKHSVVSKELYAIQKYSGM